MFGCEFAQPLDDAWDGDAGTSDVEQVLGGSVVGGDGVEVHVGVRRGGGHVDEEVVDFGFVGADVADDGDAAAADAGHDGFCDEGGEDGCDGCVDGVAALGKDLFSCCDGLFVSACDDTFHELLLVYRCASHLFRQVNLVDVFLPFYGQKSCLVGATHMLLGWFSETSEFFKNSEVWLG